MTFQICQKCMNLQVQEAEQTTDKISQKNFTSNSIIVKLLKTKDKIS